MSKEIDQVEAILRDIPETRNSDIRLMIEVWKRYYSKYILENKNTREFGINLKSLFYLPREDNIKRYRAMIQNDPKNPRYLPTDFKIAKKRRIAEKVWRERTRQSYGPVAETKVEMW